MKSPLKNTEPLKKRNVRITKAWRKIKFNNERVTYRNDKKDINIYVYKDEARDNFRVVYSIKKGYREIDRRIGVFDSFEKADKFARKRLK